MLLLVFRLDFDFIRSGSPKTLQMPLGNIGSAVGLCMPWNASSIAAITSITP